MFDIRKPVIFTMIKTNFIELKNWKRHGFWWKQKTVFGIFLWNILVPNQNIMLFIDKIIYKSCLFFVLKLLKFLGRKSQVEISNEVFFGKCKILVGTLMRSLYNFANRFIKLIIINV